MSGTILLTAAAQPLSRQGMGTLPIRRRDSQQAWDAIVKEDDESSVSATSCCRRIDKPLVQDDSDASSDDDDIAPVKVRINCLLSA